MRPAPASAAALLAVLLPVRAATDLPPGAPSEWTPPVFTIPGTGSFVYDPATGNLVTPGGAMLRPPEDDPAFNLAVEAARAAAEAQQTAWENGQMIFELDDDFKALEEKVGEKVDQADHATDIRSIWNAINTLDEGGTVTNVPCDMCDGSAASVKTFYPLHESFGGDYYVSGTPLSAGDGCSAVFDTVFGLLLSLQQHTVRHYDNHRDQETDIDDHEARIAFLESREDQMATNQCDGASIATDGAGRFQIAGWDAPSTDGNSIAKMLLSDDGGGVDLLAHGATVGYYPVGSMKAEIENIVHDVIGLYTCGGSGDYAIPCDCEHGGGGGTNGVVVVNQCSCDHEKDCDCTVKTGADVLAVTDPKYATLSAFNSHVSESAARLDDHEARLIEAEIGLSNAETRLGDLEARVAELETDFYDLQSEVRRDYVAKKDLFDLITAWHAGESVFNGDDYGKTPGGIYDPIQDGAADDFFN